MNNLSLLLLFFALCLSFNGFAQNHAVCGTSRATAQSITERLLHNRATHRNGFVQKRSVSYVPIKFHIVGRTDGSGRVDEKKIYDHLCVVNEDFADANIQFYLSEGTFNYINNSSVYNNHAGTAGQVFMTAERVNDAINVFILENANTDPNSPFTVGGYYSHLRDWIVVADQNLIPSSKLLSHELGHFFSLLHTFNGWDNDHYKVEVHGNPVGPNSPGGVPNEKMDGSNCETAGDYTCDTAPDYGFGTFWNNCNYDVGTMDPDSVIIDTDEQLIMAYFNNCPRASFYFTPTQNTDMQADLVSPQRAYVNLGITPNLTEISGSTALITPAQGETVSYDAVHLEWEAVSGADFFMLEIGDSPTFGSGSTRTLVDQNTTMLELVPNSTYFWRVRPLNAYYTCASNSPVRAFLTDNTTATTQELNFVSQWKLSPNPISTGASMSIELQSSKATNANFQLRNITGQLVQDFGERKLKLGNNNFSLDIMSQASGIYILSLITEEGTSSQRLVVQ